MGSLWMDLDRCCFPSGKTFPPDLMVLQNMLLCPWWQLAVLFQAGKWGCLLWSMLSSSPKQKPIRSQETSSWSPLSRQATGGVERHCLTSQCLSAAKTMGWSFLANGIPSSLNILNMHTFLGAVCHVVSGQVAAGSWFSAVGVRVSVTPCSCFTVFVDHEGTDSILGNEHQA